MFGRLMLSGGKGIRTFTTCQNQLFPNPNISYSGNFTTKHKLCKNPTNTYNYNPSRYKRYRPLQLPEQYYYLEGLEMEIPESVMAESGPPSGIVIGLSGPAGSGKTTVADYLKVKYDFKEICFAGPLKEITSKLFDIPLASMYDPIEKEVKDERYNKSPRQLLQWFGTDIMREKFDPDFWIKQAFWKYERFSKEDPNQNFVFSDCRFDNEAGPVGMIPNSAVCVLDVSTRLTPKQSPLLGNTRVHSTEAGISSDLINETIDNNGDVESLYEHIDQLYERLRELNNP